MILSCYMVLSQFTAGAVHPYTGLEPSLTFTLHCANAITDLIAFTPSTFIKYHSYRHDEWSRVWSLPNVCPQPFVLPPPSRLEGDSTTNISTQDHLSSNKTTPNTNTLQFDFSLPSSSSGPSFPQANNASAMGNVDLHPSHLPDSFPVIFDSGASLAISPSKSDFSGPIKTFSYD